MVSIRVLIVLISIFYPMMVYGHGDDIILDAIVYEDEIILDEIILDAAMGVFMGICVEYVICDIFMRILAILSIFAMVIGVCMGDIGFSDICNGRNLRRGVTMGVSYRATRSYRE